MGLGGVKDQGGFRLEGIIHKQAGAGICFRHDRKIINLMDSIKSMRGFRV
jgi:hypothetical protein